jgi:hypothetical protein
MLTAMSLSASFQEFVVGLPSVWTDLQVDLRLAYERL